MATARNLNPVFSEPAGAGAVGHECTHISLWSDSTTGDFLGSVEIAAPNPSALQLGERFRIEALALQLMQPAGPNETEKMAERALWGRIVGLSGLGSTGDVGLYVQYHTGDPGPGGGENLVGSRPRADPLPSTPIPRTHIPRRNWRVTE